jgi:hypothetical protein
LKNHPSPKNGFARPLIYKGLRVRGIRKNGFSDNFNNIGTAFPAEHLESALWVNIQADAAKFREKRDAAYSGEPNK